MAAEKTTVARLAKIIEPYINADEIKRTNYCSNLEAAQIAEKMREECVAKNKSFTFETVLSTDRNLKLLQKAKSKVFFIRCIYVLTSNSDINVARVESRVENGGHSVPEDKIRSRYEKALSLSRTLNAAIHTEFMTESKKLLLLLVISTNSITASACPAQLALYSPAPNH